MVYEVIVAQDVIGVIVAGWLEEELGEFRKSDVLGFEHLARNDGGALNRRLDRRFRDICIGNYVGWEIAVKVALPLRLDLQYPSCGEEAGAKADGQPAPP